MIKKLFALVLSYLMIVTPVWSATYYVAQTGAGDGLGGSYANRASIAYHNAGTGHFGTLDDDTVVLCGNITTGVLSPDGGTSGHPVTYDGYCYTTYGYGTDAELKGMDVGAGWSSFFLYKEDDTTTIVQFVDVKNIKFDNDETGEMGTSVSDAAGLYIRSADDINVDNCTFNENNNGLRLYASAARIKVTNSTFQRAVESGIIMAASSSTYYPSDITIGGSSGNGNTFFENTYKTQYDNNTVGYDIRMSQYIDGVTISHNEFSSNTAWRGMSPLLIHSAKNVLVEHNYIHNHGRAAFARPIISIKGETVTQLAENILIRYNKITDWEPDHGFQDEPYAGSVITASGNWKWVLVYCNYLKDVRGGFYPNTGTWGSPMTDDDGVDAEEWHSWGNIINAAKGSCFRMESSPENEPYDGMDELYAYFNNSICFESAYSYTSGSATSDPPDAANGTITNSAANYKVDVYNIGYTLEITSGTANGNSYDVTDTTQTTVVCGSNNLYSAGMRSGDTYEIHSNYKSAMQHSFNIRADDIYGSFKNNISVDPRPSFPNDEFHVSLKEWTDFDVKTNLLYESDAGTPDVDYRGSSTCEPCTYNSANNPDNGEYISGDPLFKDTASDDFNLSSSSSPAHEAGTTLTGPTGIPAAITTRAGGSFSYADIFASTVDLSSTPYSWTSSAQTGTWHIGAVDYAAGAANAGATRNQVAGATTNQVTKAVVNRVGE
ncbi:MAG: right-handed parallel beta-helix repeat-containing protein [Desulfosarcina sp.]|nr:right-handed parallel beta-helix repeat-containing protein [Desulfosarcina sp.]